MKKLLKEISAIIGCLLIIALYGSLIFFTGGVEVIKDWIKFNLEGPVLFNLMPFLMPLYIALGIICAKLMYKAMQK